MNRIKAMAIMAVLAVSLLAGAAFAGDMIYWADSLKNVEENGVFSLDVYANASGVSALGLAITFDTAKFDLVSFSPDVNFTLGTYNGWNMLNDEATFGYAYEGLFNPVLSSLTGKIATVTLRNKMAAGQSADVSFYSEDPNGWAELYTFMSTDQQYAQAGAVSVTATAVPEPSTIVGFAVSGMGLLGTLRRRVRK